jgi:hypothetical protein
MSHGEKLLLIGFILITSSDIRAGWPGALQVAVALVLGVLFANWKESTR